MRIDSPIMNNAVITGSFSGSFLGSVTPSAGATIEANSVAFSNITSTPTLISSSAQIGVGDGALTQNNFTNTLKSKLDAVEASADVTDATNVTAAGALMDSELAEIATVKALTAAGISGSLSAAALVALGANLVSGSAANVRTFLNVENGATADQSNAEIVAAVEAGTDSNTFTDADHSKLNAIEASADVTDTANVTSAGALMDSEVSALALIKGLTAAQISGSGNIRFEALNAATASYALKSGAGIVSASVLSSPSQGTVRLATNGVNTDVDSGLQSGDSPTFSGLTISNNVTVNGNLSVLGDATELQVSNLRIEDKLIEVASGSADSSAADGAGLSIDGAGKALTWNHANTRFNFDAALNVAGNITTSGTVDGRDVDADGTKLDGVEASADVTDATNVTAAGALMDSELAEIATVKALTKAGISGSLSATAVAGLGANLVSSSAQITGVVITADSANTSRRMVFTESDDATDTNGQLFKDSAANFFYNPSTNTLSVPNIAASGNVDGRDVSADGTKLDAIEASADVTDATNVTAAGALMDSELAEIATVKALTAAGISGSLSAAALVALGANLVSGSAANVRTFLNVENGADVTDTTNVTSAGALMDSEVTNLADVKAINQSLVTTADVRFDSIGVNTAAPGTSGVIRAANDVVAFYSSDERLKDNVSNIPNALDKVESLRGVEFDWNDKQEVYEGHDIGVIAQDVEKVLPEIVENRDNGYKAVKYEKLTAVLIEAVKELSAKIKELENK